jgi:hypothetical protein
LLSFLGRHRECFSAIVNGWKTINVTIIAALVLHLKYLWMNGSFKTNKGGLSKV